MDDIKRDDALTKYRIKKLRLLNLSANEIDEKIKQLNSVVKEKIEDIDLKKKFINEQKDLIFKLKNGYYKSTPVIEDPSTIVKNGINQKKVDM
jgi:hypothetical protein